MTANLRIDTALDKEQELNHLLAQQQEIQARIASLLPSTAPPSSYQFHRSPIHKQQQQQQQQQRRSNVPRSMSSNGTPTMSRHLSQDRIEVPTQLRRTSSQRSAPPMARHNSRGTSSQRSGNLPFTQTGAMPPPLHTESRRENPAITAWNAQDQPLSSYTLTHQPPQLQRSMSQRTPELTQVLEDLEDPSSFLGRTMGTPTVAVSPTISIPSPATLSTHRLSTSSFNMPTPSTPTSDSLTTATTLTSNMSRQNSLCNESILQSMEMMNCNSQASFSTTDMNDQFMYNHVTPHFSSSHHSRRSSNEEQAKLLVGAGASHESHFSHSYPQIPSSGPFGEKMEKCQSNESTSSSSSRSLQRLQVQNSLAAARAIMPKGGNEDNAMSRENSSHSMSRQNSKDGSDKVAISKPSYQRPKHDRVFCKQCESHSEGFRGEHELRRHQDREHKSMVKKWVCMEPIDGRDHPKPVLPLLRCKACNNQKKKYGAYYNAAAHLRRAHFKPKSKGKPKNNKTDDGEKRGGKGGGDWPPMSELKFWMKEVEEPATDFPLTESQQQEEDASDDETLELSMDERMYPQHTIPSLNNTSNFNNSFLNNTSPILNIYPDAVNLNNDMFGTQNIPLSLTSTQQNTCMEQSMYSSSSQNSFHNFSPNHSLFQTDTLAFFDPSLQNFDDQILAGPDFVNFSY